MTGPDGPDLFRFRSFPSLSRENTKYSTSTSTVRSICTSKTQMDIICFCCFYFGALLLPVSFISNRFLLVIIIVKFKKELSNNQSGYYTILPKRILLRYRHSTTQPDRCYCTMNSMPQQQQQPQMQPQMQPNYYPQQGMQQQSAQP